jgi:hypothetical protein
MVKFQIQNFCHFILYYIMFNKKKTEKKNSIIFLAFHRFTKQLENAY